MVHSCLKTCLCLASAALVQAESTDSLTLIQEGVARASIVLSADADETEKLATEELNAYLRKATGTSLPLADAQAGVPAEILVGVRDPDLRRELGLATLAFDGFVIDCDDKRLVLAGNVPEGTLNAIYAFLEDILGVRWFMPTDLGETVPRTKTVRVPYGRHRIEPRFINRRNHGIDLSIPGPGAVWRRRIRITSHDLSVPFNRYSHNLYGVFPASKYGKSHPEYFPLIDGARRVPDTDGAQNWQPCTTNPEVIELTIASAREWFRTHPRSNFFSVGINDSAAFCTCANCTALDVPGATFRGTRMVSDRYFTFVKAVADALLQSHPDKYVTCIAYYVVESPPVNVKLPPNVGVVITQDVGQWHDPTYKQADMELATAWSRAAGAFGTYDYTGLTWMLPRVYPHAMAESLRFYADIGAVAVTNEAYPTWWYAAPQLYLRAKLMWDPYLDVDSVLKDFYTGFFGPAAADMADFYNVLERCMTRERPGRLGEGMGSVLDQMDLWRREDLTACQAALSAARQKVQQQTPAAERVEFVARGFAWSEAMLEEYWQAQRVRELTATELKATELLTAVRNLLTLTSRRENVWESIRDDPLLSGIYHLVFESYSSRVATWRSYLTGSVGIGFSALMSEPGGLTRAQILELLSAEQLSSELGDELRGRLWVKENPTAPNLCKNAGFGLTEPTDPPVTGLEWVSTDTPADWDKWTLKPENRVRLTWEQRGGPDGSECTKITGVANGCFIQVIPAAPGERYFASVWARTEGSPNAVVRLLVKWQDADQAWILSKPHREAKLPAAGGQWRQISLVFRIPDGVANAVILPSAKDQQPDDAAWFDDVRVIRLP